MILLRPNSRHSSVPSPQWFPTSKALKNHLSLLAVAPMIQIPAPGPCAYCSLCPECASLMNAWLSPSSPSDPCSHATFLVMQYSLWFTNPPPCFPHSTWYRLTYHMFYAFIMPPPLPLEHQLHKARVAVCCVHYCTSSTRS